MDSRTNSVDVATAAQHFGISAEAIYKRIRRGQLRATRVDGRWFVRLGGLDSRNGRADNPNEPLDEPPSNGSPSALVAELHGEVAFLRAQLEAMQERLREAHVLLAQERVLPAPVSPQGDTPNGPALDTSRPWWARWLGWRP